MTDREIVVDFRMHQSSGIGVYLKNLIERFKIFKPILLVPEPLIGGIERKTYIFNKEIYSLMEQLSFPFVIPQCKIFWSPHYNVPVFPIRAKKRVVTIHDVYHITSHSSLSQFKKWYAKLMLYIAVTLSDKVITVSDFSKREILRFFPGNSDKIVVIKNGVDNHPVWKNFSEIRQKYNLPEKYILFVGNVKPHKNIKRLLESYLLLTNEIQKTHKIVIAGKKDGFITNDSTLFLWISENPNLSQKVIFTGFVADEDLATIYHNASLFVFPSLYEGFGLPPLEAMVNNCPTIVSDIPVMREICHDAVLYFDPLDPGDIAKKIEDVVNNGVTKANLIKKGAAQAQFFTWEKAAEKHTNLFFSLLIR